MATLSHSGRVRAGVFLHLLGLALFAAPLKSQQLDLPPKPVLAPAGYQLILDYEVGGGEPYYNKFLRFPTVPPEQSGVTIGVGYDLRFNSREAVLCDWYMTGRAPTLAQCAGLSHEASLRVLSSVRTIEILWPVAQGVFDRVTLSRFYALTAQTFDGFDDLDPRAQAALVSLVFNRGGSLIGPARREMRELVPVVRSKDYRAMAGCLRRMKRLWPTVQGLIRRREAEACLIETCLIN